MVHLTPRQRRQSDEGGFALLRHVLNADHTYLLAALSLFIFLLTYFARVSHATSDPQLSLLVSQALLEHETIALDAYREQLALSVPFDRLITDGMVQPINGHYHYLFPTGPSLFALPAVFAANLAGKDMAAFADNQWLQNVLAGVVCALTFLLLYRIGRLYLPAASSLVVALVSTLGSALVSTLGTAYWNTGPAVLFLLLSLWLVARHDREREESGAALWPVSARARYGAGGDGSSGEKKGAKAPTTNGVLLGFFLFAAYFCRPTAAIFVALVLLYVLLYDRRLFLVTAATALAFLLLFLAWSQLAYGRWFPPYYRPERLQAVPGIAPQAIYGVLLSPSRGLLVYSPFFIVTLLGAAWAFPHLRRRPLFWLALAWFGLHLPVPGRTARWWGGHAFGPRLLTEVIPALVLLTFLVWQVARQQAGPRLRAAGAASFLVLGLAGIFVNSGRGLYMHHPSIWNMQPNVDEYPATVFDWRYPQFLATAETVQARHEAFVQGQFAAGRQQLVPYRLGTPLTTPEILMFGWEAAGQGYRATTRRPAVYFLLADVAGGTYVIRLTHASPLSQTVTLLLNDDRVATFPSGTTAQIHTFAVGREWLRAGELNRLSWRVPGRYVPAVGYLRRPEFSLLALAIDRSP